MSTQVQLVKTGVIDLVEKRIRTFQQSGELDLPANYSPSNAMKSAWLVIQETKDRAGKPAVEVCTRESMANALLDMIVQGLNPAKNQCYFIVYGEHLACQRSYFGDMHLARTLRPDIRDIFADVVYADDILEYEKVRGRTVITRHSQKLQNIDPKKLVAAYCTVVYEDCENTTIMTLEECKQSWKKSKMSAVGADGQINEKSTHGQFTAEMMKKTVIRKACKTIINSSDDSTIIRLSRQLEKQEHEELVEAEIREHANTVEVQLEDKPVIVDTDTGEVTEPAAKPDF